MTTADPGRVVRRHTAGLLKAPPAMVEEITEWVQGTFSAWLAEAPNLDLVEQALDARKVLYSIDTTELKRLRQVRRDLLHWGKKPNAWGRYEDIEDAVEGTRLQEVLPDIDRRAFKAMTPQETTALYEQTAKRFLPWIDREIDEAARELREAKDSLDSLINLFTTLELDIYQQPMNARRWVKISPEIQQAAAQRGKSSDTANPVRDGFLRFFDANLDGWEYADLIPKGVHFGKVRVFLIVNETMPDEVGGSYADATLKVYPRVPKLLQSKSGYKRLMREIETAVRHELQHYTQEFLRAAGIKDFGNPSRNIRDLRFSPEGFAAVEGLDDHQRTMMDLKEHGQKSYPLHDAEFYPWLEDNVEVFREWAAEQGLEGSAWDRARKDWVESKGSDIIRAQGKGNARFWKALMKHEPDKWRKAVGEFWKATEQPRSSRVASRYVEAR